MTNNGTVAPAAVDGAAADNTTALGKSKWNHTTAYIGGTMRPIRNRAIFYHDRVFVVLCSRQLPFPSKRRVPGTKRFHNDVF